MISDRVATILAQWVIPLLDAGNAVVCLNGACSAFVDIVIFLPHGGAIWLLQARRTDDATPLRLCELRTALRQMGCHSPAIDIGPIAAVAGPAAGAGGSGGSTDLQVADVASGEGVKPLTIIKNNVTVTALRPDVRPLAGHRDDLAMYATRSEQTSDMTRRDGQLVGASSCPAAVYRHKHRFGAAADA